MNVAVAKSKQGLIIGHSVDWVASSRDFDWFYVSPELDGSSRAFLFFIMTTDGPTHR